MNSSEIFDTYKSVPGPGREPVKNLYIARNCGHVLDHITTCARLYNQLKSLIEIFYSNCLFSGIYISRKKIQNYKYAFAKS